MSIAERNRHREGASLTVDALNRYDAAVQSGQFLNQRQAYSGSFVGSAGRAHYAMKPFEEMRNLVFGNAGACVTYRQQGAVSGRFKAHFDLAFKGKFESIR